MKSGKTFFLSSSFSLLLSPLLDKYEYSVRGGERYKMAGKVDRGIIILLWSTALGLALFSCPSARGHCRINSAPSSVYRLPVRSFSVSSFSLASSIPLCYPRPSFIYRTTVHSPNTPSTRLLWPYSTGLLTFTCMFFSFYFDFIVKARYCGIVARRIVIVSFISFLYR